MSGRDSERYDSHGSGQHQTTQSRRNAAEDKQHRRTQHTTFQCQLYTPNDTTGIGTPPLSLDGTYLLKKEIYESTPKVAGQSLPD